MLHVILLLVRSDFWYVSCYGGDVISSDVSISFPICHYCIVQYERNFSMIILTSKFFYRQCPNVLWQLLCDSFFLKHLIIILIRSIVVMWLESWFLDTEVDGSNPVFGMLYP